MSDAVSISRAQIIHDKANEHVADLGNYGVDATKLATLQTLINETEQLIKKKGHVKEDSQTSTEMLDIWIDDTEDLVDEKMDHLMKFFKKCESHFYKTYFNSREIIDIGGGRKKTETVSDTPSENQ